MVVKATLHKLRVTEVATTLSPNGRSRPPHLRSWRDGWRHLRFMLLFSPRWLFLYPGLSLFAVGLAAMAWLLPHARVVGGVSFDVHSLLYSALAVIAGSEAVQFWLYAKLYGAREGIMPQDPWFVSAMRVCSIEAGLIVSGTLLVVGVVLAIFALSSWDAKGFGLLRPSETMRLVIPSVTLILLAFKIAFGVFFLKLLEIRATRTVPEEAAEQEARAS
jgi:hypothetical protein